MKYVLGFVFDESFDFVALIRKNRAPAGAESMIGRWNGIGGKIEEGEDIYDAMSREFEEETSVSIPSSEWIHFMSNNEDELEILYAVTDDVFHSKTIEDEDVMVTTIQGAMKCLPLAPNVNVYLREAFYQAQLRMVKEPYKYPYDSRPRNL